MSTHANLLAIGDSTLESSGSIGFTDKLFRLSVVLNFVMDFRAWQATRLSSRPDCHGLNCGNRHDCLGQAAVELEIPRGVRAQAWYNPSGHHLENAAKSVASRASLVD